MKIIKDEDGKEDQEWKAHSVKEALQMMDDAVAYQKYWNEQLPEHCRNNTWEASTKFTAWIGLYSHTTDLVSVTKAKKYLKEMWASAEDEVERSVNYGTYPDGYVYAEIKVTNRLKFYVHSEMTGTHRNQDVFDKVEALRDELITAKKEEEE
jgi:hypothetical protein